MKRVKWMRQEPRILGITLDLFPITLTCMVLVTLIGLYFMMNVTVSALYVIMFIDALIYVYFYYKSANEKRNRQQTKLPDKLTP